MVRKDRHAYHQWTHNAELDGRASLDELPDQQFVNQRLAQAQLNKLTLEEQGVPSRMLRSDGLSNSTPLINRIPPPTLPTTLSIGGYSREPIPVMPEERDLAQAAVEEGIKGVFGTYQHACPPPADTCYEVEDQGVSSPEFFRLSMYNMPVNESLRQSTKLPLAMYLRPFAREEVPLADFSEYDGQTMPPRCRRCRAYMNPSMRFTRGGGKFVCNLCLFENPTPADYFQPTNHENKRVDWMERPELAFGTYEFVVAKHGEENEISDEMQTAGRIVNTHQGEGYDKGQGPHASVYGEPEKPFRHVFCCETSRDGVQNGTLSTFMAAIREALPYFKPHTKIALMTFDSKITYYRLSASGPQLLVATPPYVPVPPDVFFDPVTQKEDLVALLNRIPELYATSADRNSCLGDAVKSLQDLKDFNSGGRVTVLSSSLPSMGQSKLVARDRAIAGISPDNEAPMHKQLFNPTSQVYLDLASTLAKNGWGCDVLAVPTTSYVDLANIGVLCRKTGGKLLYYPRFALERDERRIIADIMALVASPVHARQVQLKIRTSTGLQISSKYMDPAYEWGFMDSDSCLVATCEYDGQLDAKLDTHFQAAILYTTESGEKRVRVCNQLAGVTSKVKSLLKYVDIDVISMAIVRQTLYQLGEHPTSDLRKAVLAKLQDIFASVRKLVGYGVPESQLLMPTNLRMLPIYMLAFTKSIVLGSRAFSSDARVANAAYLATADPVKLSLALYPRIYEVHSDKIFTKLARFDDIVGATVPVLAFDGRQLYLWLSDSILPSMLSSLFGVSDLADVSPWIDEVAATDDKNSIASRLSSISRQEALRVTRSWVPLQLVRQGRDGAEYQLRQLMVEDTIGDSPSYMNFIVKVHEAAKKASKEKPASWF